MTVGPRGASYATVPGSHSHPSLQKVQTIRVCPPCIEAQNKGTTSSIVSSSCIRASHATLPPQAGYCMFPRRQKEKARGGCLFNQPPTHPQLDPTYLIYGITIKGKQIIILRLHTISFDFDKERHKITPDEQMYSKSKEAEYQIVLV